MPALTAALEDLLRDAPGTYGLVARHLGTGEEIRIRDDRAFPSASVIKLPIMVEVFSQADEGRFRLSERRPVSLDNQVPPSGVLQDLAPGLSPTVLDLVTLMIAVSDNTATNELIDLVGFEGVNQTAQELGLTETRLLNKLNVIRVKREGINMTSPRDMAGLLEAIARGRVVSHWACEKMVDILKRQQVSEMIPRLLPKPAGELIGAIPPVVCAHKTGSITGVRNDVGLVYTPRAAWVLAVMSEGVPDEAEAERTVAQISRAVYDAWGA